MKTRMVGRVSSCRMVLLSSPAVQIREQRYLQDIAREATPNRKDIAPKARPDCMASYPHIFLEWARQGQYYIRLINGMREPHTENCLDFVLWRSNV